MAPLPRSRAWEANPHTIGAPDPVTAHDPGHPQFRDDTADGSDRRSPVCDDGHDRRPYSRRRDPFQVILIEFSAREVTGYSMSLLPRTRRGVIDRQFRMPLLQVTAR